MTTLPAHIKKAKDLLYYADWAVTWANTAASSAMRYKNTNNLAAKQDVLSCIINFQNHLHNIIRVILK